MKSKFLLIFLLYCCFVSAQVVIRGVVYDEYLEPFGRATVSADGKKTSTNIDGEFTLRVDDVFPKKILVTSDRFQDEEVIVSSSDEEINIILKENAKINELVVSASRIPERIIESPVTIRRFGKLDIRNNSSNSVFDALQSLNGVQGVNQDYGYKSINTRGFTTFVNNRFVTQVDGMDMSTPVPVLSQGNFAGLGELDIENIEILPGASSALYGANAYNGLMIINTKSPFDHTGISSQIKRGYTAIETSAPNYQYTDVAMRLAYAFDDSFAAKVSFQYLDSSDWEASDYRDISADGDYFETGTRQNHGGYNGINVYGDGHHRKFKTIDFSDYNLINNDYIDPYVLYNHSSNSNKYLFSQTGYRENEIYNNNSRSIRLNAALHFRPFTNKAYEFILNSTLSKSNYTVHGDNTRYRLEDYYLHKYKAEFKGPDFYVRGYFTGNKADKVFDIVKSGILLSDNSIKDYDKWYDAFYTNMAKYNIVKARANADKELGLFVPGSISFKDNLSNLQSTTVVDGGVGINDQSSYSHFDGNYNFSKLFDKWADFQVGANFRKYHADSNGTIFNDLDEDISVEEYGVYGQFQKSFFDKRFKVTTSARYDKSRNFDGSISPRIALNYIAGEERNNVIRLSYQTGFRNPTLIEQYGYMKEGTGMVSDFGSSRDNLDRLQLKNKNAVYVDDKNFYESVGLEILDIPGAATDSDGNENITYTNRDRIINNSIIKESLIFSEGQDPNLMALEKSTYKEVTPELVRSLEFGYRSILVLNNRTNIEVDFNAFVSDHSNFIFTQDLIVPNYGNIYSSDQKIKPTKEDLDRLNDPVFMFNPVIKDNFIIADGFAQYALQKAVYDGFENSDIREFSLVTNAKSGIMSYGYGLDLSTKLFRDYSVNASYNFIDYKLDDKDNGRFTPHFNTSKHSAKISVSNENVYNNLGFNVSANWFDSYKWWSNFASGDVDGQWLLNAQLTYYFPSLNSMIKLGATNIFAENYYVAPGAGKINSTAYVTFLINN